MKFITICIYVDLETGEQLTPETVKESYNIVNKSKHYKQDDTKHITYCTITNECKHTNQLKLF